MQDDFSFMSSDAQPLLHQHCTDKFCRPLIAKARLPFVTLDAGCSKSLLPKRGSWWQPTTSPPPPLDQTHKQGAASQEILRLELLRVLGKGEMRAVPAECRTGGSVATGLVQSRAADCLSPSTLVPCST